MNDIQYNKIYEQTKNFGRTQFVKEIQMQINDNKKKKEIITNLSNRLSQYESKINNTIDYVKDCLEHLCTVDEIEILNKLGYNSNDSE